MILTYKVKHQHDFRNQLRMAKKVAKFAIANRDKLSSKEVKHIGLPSAISNQILREYGRNKKCHSVKHVKLILPSQSIKLDDKTITLIPLKVSFQYQFSGFIRVAQVEVDSRYFYVSVEIPDAKPLVPEGWVGVDRNTTGHCAVAACSKTDKVIMLGKKAKHIHEKYRKIRKSLQRQKKLKKLKTIKRREFNIVKDLNHKISRKIVNYAKENNCGIKMEDLTGIRNNRKQAKSFKVHLNSWAYYQLQQFVDYKAQLAGVPVQYIEPAYTSQTCHKCGCIGNRNGKAFKCPHCGYTGHADVNASWNISAWQLLAEPKPEQRPQSGSPFGVYSQRFVLEGDNTKGNTDIPQVALSCSCGQQQNPTPPLGGRQLVGGL